MIIITVKYSIKSGYRDEVMKYAVEMARYSRTEKGCLAYDQLPSAENDQDIFVIEKWETQEDIAAHGQSRQYAEFNAKRSPYVIEGSRSVQRYEVIEIS